MRYKLYVIIFFIHIMINIFIYKNFNVNNTILMLLFWWFSIYCYRLDEEDKKNKHD